MVPLGLMSLPVEHADNEDTTAGYCLHGLATRAAIEWEVKASANGTKCSSIVFASVMMSYMA